ncbi:MAG TPA: SDR family oxidoreductase [Mycobacteriales bacterium]|nr:SDR family oxidoreductase [Mycobacteriales bacterium]
MKGKVALVTGANTGIGLETARGLARQGATTVIACRNATKAQRARDDIAASTGNDDVHVVALDLSDLDSVEKAAADVLSRWDRLDVLVNNAGGMWSRRETTKQGFEQTFGVNHLAPFLLTNRLLDRLAASGSSRIVNVTSVASHHAFGGMRWDDLQHEKTAYKATAVYCHSKLANVLFTRGLAERGFDSYAVHPGWVRSDFAMDGDTSGFTRFYMSAIRPLQVSPATGARTSIFCATSPEAAGRSGLYWVRRKVHPTSRFARADADVTRLWDVSAQLVADAGFPLATS